MRDTSALAVAYETEVARPVPRRERWPILWAIAFAVSLSLVLWVIIFAAAGAIWNVLTA
jgi:hypothetical protein